MKLLLLLVAAPVFAQYWYPKNTFTIGVGAGQPRADLAAPFADSVGISVAYGRRLNRYVQADLGLDTRSEERRVGKECRL